MAEGQISLNGVAYKTTNLPVQSLAQQTSPKIASGNTDYASYDQWSNWITEDWTEGMGRTKPHRNGGFLWSDCDTRVPGQIILRQMERPVNQYPADSDDWTAGQEPYWLPDQIDEYTLYTVEYGVNAISWSMDGYVDPQDVDDHGQMTFPTVWVRGNQMATTLRCILYSSAGGTELESEGVTVPPLPPGALVPIHFGFLAEDTDVNYAAALYVMTEGASLDVLCSTTRAGGTTYEYLYATDAWTQTTEFYPIFHAAYIMSRDSSVVVEPLVPEALSNILVVPTGSGAMLYKQEISGSSRDRHLVPYTDGIGFDPDDMISTGESTVINTNGAIVYFDDKLWMAQGELVQADADGGNLVTHTGIGADFVARASGLLWRVDDRTVYYISDTSGAGTASNWTEVGEVGTAPYQVRGLAEMGDSVYIAMDDGLFRVAPGDFIVPALPFGSASADNGRSMVNWQGALYVATGGSVWRITQDGAIQDIWVNRDDDLPTSLLTTVFWLTTTSTALIAVVGNTSSTQIIPSVLAYYGQGWHMVAYGFRHPLNFYTNGLRANYDRDRSRLWITGDGFVSWLPISDYTINPYNDPTSLYAQSGWIEWDWFDGTVREEDKDWESVTVMGELTDNQYAQVYYRFEDQSTWTLLGNCRSHGEELRFDTPRVAHKRLKLGLRLITWDPNLTPKVEGVRVKYQIMLNNRFRWSMQIDVSGGYGGAPNQEMPDGSRNALSASEIKDNLDQLAALRDVPFEYVDINAATYEVKVVDARFTYTAFRWNEIMGVREWEGAYNLVIEAVQEYVV